MKLDKFDVCPICGAEQVGIIRETNQSTNPSDGSLTWRAYEYACNCQIGTFELETLPTANDYWQLSEPCHNTMEVIAALRAAQESADKDAKPKQFNNIDDLLAGMTDDGWSRWLDAFKSGGICKEEALANILESLKIWSQPDKPDQEPADDPTTRAPERPQFSDYEGQALRDEDRGEVAQEQGE